jgi:amino acid transporter
MFEGLEWKNAFKRAAIIFAIWMFSIYALSIAFPEYFNLGFDSGAGIATFAINAVFFFFFFVVFTAFMERSKKRNAARLRAQKAPKKDKPGAKTTTGPEAVEDGEAGTGSLKGRHNPNTSRKKASRRRR